MAPKPFSHRLGRWLRNHSQQYTVTAGCGHTTTINLVGPTTWRDRHLRWMQSTDGTCNPCYASTKRAIEANRFLGWWISEGTVQMLHRLNTDGRAVTGTADGCSLCQ